MIDWDAWRASYSAMTYAEHQAFYDVVWERHPDQAHFDLPRARAFLARMLRPGDRVFEVGGWRGELAEASRDLLPEGVTWTNAEITRGAVEHPIPRGEWYRAFVPPVWVWEMGQWKADELVASHVIEHMTRDHLAGLLASVAAVRAAFVQSPLPDHDRPDWAGYQGSHVLDASWDDVEALFAVSGLMRDRGMDGPDSRVFVR